MHSVNKLALGSIEQLTKKIANLELANNKKTVAISGLHVYSSDKDEIGSEIQDFFESQLDIRPSIDEVFFIGMSNPPTCVVSLTSLQDKRIIMSRKSRLKDIQNRDENGIYINDYWTAENNEKKKVEHEIKDTNEKMPDEKKKIVEYKGAQMMLDGKPWQHHKKVHTPTSMELIDLDPEHLGSILKIKLIKGQEVSDRGSTFTGYTITPAKYSDIQDAYCKLKLLHPGADHVMCAFYMSECDVFAQDYCDDGEHGGERHLLDYLLQNKLKQRAVFVVRYFGGVKLADHRYTCIQQAAVNAVKKLPENVHLGITQPAQSDTPIDLSKPPGSPQGKYRRVRTGPGRKSNKQWRRGNHTTGHQRGTTPINHYSNRGGSSRGGSNSIRGYARKTTQNRPSHNTRRTYEPRKSRYTDYFHSSRPDQRNDYGEPTEDWSQQNSGSFNETD